MPGTLECQEPVTDIDCLYPPLWVVWQGLASWNPQAIRILTQDSLEGGWCRKRCYREFTIPGETEHKKQSGTFAARSHALCIVTMLSYTDMYVSKHSRATPAYWVQETSTVIGEIAFQVPKEQGM